MLKFKIVANKKKEGGLILPKIITNTNKDTQKVNDKNNNTKLVNTYTTYEKLIKQYDDNKELSNIS